jgi:hypothetical protein
VLGHVVAVRANEEAVSYALAAASAGHVGEVQHDSSLTEQQLFRVHLLRLCLRRQEHDLAVERYDVEEHRQRALRARERGADLAPAALAAIAALDGAVRNRGE